MKIMILILLASFAGLYGTRKTGLGKELVLDGTFDEADVWTFGGDWTSWAGLTAYNGLGSGTLSQDLGSKLRPSTTYRVEFDVTLNGGAVNILLGGTSKPVSGGANSFEITTGTESTEIQFIVTEPGDPIEIDNVSVKEIKGKKKHYTKDFINRSVK